MLTTSETRAREARERPIIFSAPMVRAILAGRKTQTRRALKLQPIPFAVDDKGTPCDVSLLHVEGDRLPRVTLGRVVTMQEVPFAVGDRLWVREAVRAEDCVVTWDHGVRYLADDAWVKAADHEDVESDAFGRWWLLNAYRSDDPDLTGGQKVPSIHMPRWASRLTLEVTEVRVERLQDISREDAIAEGCIVVRDACNVFEGTGYHKAGLCHSSPVTAFGIAWDEIHGPDAFEANPWVAAITFQPLPASLESQKEGAADSASVKERV